MKRALLFSVALASACSASLDVPDGAVIACTDDSDCPAPLRCQLAAAQCIAAADLDVTPPMLVSVTATTPTTILLTFNEPLDPATASDASHFGAEPVLAVDSVSVGADGQTIVVVVAREEDDAAYTLTVSGITDRAGNLIASPGDTGHFTGIGTPPDTRAPALTAPSNGASISGVAPVTLRWSVVAGATSYIVDIGTASDVLSEPIPNSPFTVAIDRPGGVPSNHKDVPIPGAGTYFWRARADITTEAPHAARFDVFDDTIYVYCEAGHDPCLPGSGTGTSSDPFLTVAQALAAAQLHGATNVAIADRGSGSPYFETVVAVDGVNLRGGYDNSFSEAARSTGSFKTEIQGTGTALFASTLTKPILFERIGFSTGEGGTAHAVEFGALTSATFDHVTITARQASLDSTAMAFPIEEVGDVRIVDSTITTGPAVSTIAIDAHLHSLTIERSTIQAGNSLDGFAGVSFGIRQIGGALTLTDSSVASGAFSANAIGIDAFGDGQSFRIERSTIVGSSASFNTTALRLSTTGTAVLANNVIDAKDAAVSTGYDGTEVLQPATLVANTIGAGPFVAVTDGPATSAIAVILSHGVIANNIVFLRNTNAASACFSVPGFNGDPSNVEDNFYFGCDEPIHDFQGAGPSIDINDCSTYPSARPPVPTVCTGNFTAASPETFFSDFAGGDYHLNGAPPSVRFGGRDTSTATYGTVIVDRDNAARTCPTPLTACESIGAYESN